MSPQSLYWFEGRDAGPPTANSTYFHVGRSYEKNV